MMLNSRFLPSQKIWKLSFGSSFPPADQFLEDLPFPRVMNYCSSRAHMLPHGEWKLRAEWHYIIIIVINNDNNSNNNSISCAQLYNPAVPAPMQKDDQNKSFLSSGRCGCQTNLTCGETSRLWGTVLLNRFGKQKTFLGKKKNRMQLKIISGAPASKVKPAHRELGWGWNPGICWHAISMIQSNSKGRNHSSRLRQGMLGSWEMQKMRGSSSLDWLPLGQFARLG